VSVPRLSLSLLLSLSLIDSAVWELLLITLDGISATREFQNARREFCTRIGIQEVQVDD
jgi:hypothetical protein